MASIASILGAGLTLVFALALPAAAVEPDAAKLEAWRKLCADQFERVVTFAKAGAGKAGSLDLEVREQALALARKLDAKSDKTRNVFAQKHAMDPDEQAADQRLRAAVAQREKERAKDPAEAGPPAKPDNLKEEFEALRFHVLAEQAAFAERLTLDPDEPGVIMVRALALKATQDLVGTTRWPYEKKFKERLAKLASARYEPWAGTWTCAKWGDIAMTQKDGKVAGTWSDGKLAGDTKGRSLVGTWAGKGQRGTFVFTLGTDDQGFDARLTVEMTDPENWSATRRNETADAGTTDAAPADAKQPEAAPDPGAAK